jgi:hypothetical protein
MRIMLGNRREFFKASAAVGVLGASASSATAKQVDKFVALMHSTTLEPELEQALLGGLSSSGTYEADPTKDITAKKTVVIERYYGLGDYANLNKVGDRINDQSSWNLVIALGGNPAVIAVNAKVSQTPLLVAYVPKTGDTVESNPYVRGFNLSKDTSGSNYSFPGSAVAKLNDSYGISNAQMVLLYNGNSGATATYSGQWPSGAHTSDASENKSKANKTIKLANAIQSALNQVTGSPRALVFTPDPYFTLHRREIIQILRRMNLSNVVFGFPFTEYFIEANTNAGFTTDNCFALGPTLADVYKQVGQQAAGILDSFTANVTGTSGVTFTYIGLS